MLAADHSSEQFRLAPPDLCYLFDVEVVASQVLIASMVAPACHRRNCKSALEPSEPHGTPDTEYRIICMRLNDKHPAPAARKRRLYLFAILASQELAYNRVGTFTACR